MNSTIRTTAIIFTTFFLASTVYAAQDRVIDVSQRFVSGITTVLNAVNNLDKVHDQLFLGNLEVDGLAFEASTRLKIDFGNPIDPASTDLLNGCTDGHDGEPAIVNAFPMEIVTIWHDGEDGLAFTLNDNFFNAYCINADGERWLVADLSVSGTGQYACVEGATHFNNRGVDLPPELQSIGDQGLHYYKPSAKNKAVVQDTSYDGMITVPGTCP